ncbi:MAG: kelch repeat-containing protein [Chitinophagales bacterium]
MKSISILFAILLAVPFFSNADSWIQKADFAGNPRGGAVGFSINGKAYIGTGSAMNEGYSKTFWEYDPATDSWTQKADLAGAGRVSAAAFSIGDKGYIGTGQITDNAFTDDFWEYDPATNTWTQKASFPGVKRSIAFAFSIGSKGFLGGGATNYTKEDFWEYDPATDIWTQKADYGGGKVGGQAEFVIADKAYIGTGRDNILAYRKDFWQYDPSTNLWTQKADFPGQERAGSVGLSIDGLGYLGLGVTIDMQVLYLSDFWQYDPVADSWFQQTDYPDGAGDGFTGVSIDDTAYVGLGGTSGKQWWQYDPDSIATAADGEFIKQKPPAVFPNPLITSSSVSFSLEQNSIVTIELFDLSGSKMKTLFNENSRAGQHEVKFNREQLPSGIYLLQLKMNQASSVIKVIIQ